MAHKGRAYPYHFRRDFALREINPYLSLPDAWKTSARLGTIGGFWDAGTSIKYFEALNPDTDGPELLWRHDYANVAGIAVSCTLRYRLRFDPGFAYYHVTREIMGQTVCWSDPFNAPLSMHLAEGFWTFQDCETCPQAGCDTFYARFVPKLWNDS
jgi:hypothetical protein